MSNESARLPASCAAGKRGAFPTRPPAMARRPWHRVPATASARASKLLRGGAGYPGGRAGRRSGV